MNKIKLDLTVTESFLDTVIKKFHFSEEDRACFYDVGRKLEAAAQKEAGFWYAEQGEAALAVLTLGAGVDVLQEEYTKAGLLTECYMAETIAGELMMNAYRDFNCWVERNTGWHVARYHFFGAQEAGVQTDAAKRERDVAWQSQLHGDETVRIPDMLSLEEMSAVLHKLGITQVQCNHAYCLTPRKSVVFLAELTDDAGVRCEGVCVSCGREDCPNRCGREQEAVRLRWPDLTGRALPYGYARILGK